MCDTPGQRTPTRWLVNLDLLFVATGFETAFGLVTCGAETVFAAEFDDGENGELSPMSPWNHAHVLAWAG
jgi:hypothetical protein